MKAKFGGYLILVTCFYSILYVASVLEARFYDPAPQPLQDVWWAHALVILFLFGFPVVMAHLFGKVGYLGVALCVFLCIVVPSQIMAYWAAYQFAPDGEITMRTPWVSLVAPSVLAATVLFVCRHITNRLKMTRLSRAL